MNIILIGTGYMASEYAKILSFLCVKYSVIGNKKEKCDIFSKRFNIKVFDNSLENNTNILSNFTHAIIATPIELLTNHLDIVLNSGIQNILVEKPCGLNVADIIKINNSHTDANVIVAYNRRFYKSVNIAKELIKNDGGLLSFDVDITEIINKIKPEKYAKNVLNNWILSNTSHVIDLAFYLGGRPTELNVKCHSNIEWHYPAIFVGHGITINNALFSLHGNWKSIGRWKIEIFTKNHSILLCPLEKLQIKNIDDNEYKFFDIEENEFKPGLCDMTHSFLFNICDERLLKLKDHIYNIINIYNKFYESCD